MNPQPALRGQILTAVAAVPSPTRPQARRYAGAILVATAAAMVAVFQLFGGLGHSHARPAVWTWSIAAGMVVVAVAVTVVALGRRTSMLPRPPWPVSVAALALLVTTVGWPACFVDQYPEPPARVGWRCLGLGLSLAGLPLLATLWWFRGTAAHNGRWTGVALAATGAAWAAVLVDLWCPLTNVPHLIVGHALPVVVAVVAGALVGRKVLPVRG